jgi:DNA polymerase III epsilon subunit-like protein
MHWKETPIHFIDFEGARGCGVLEYGVATVLGGEIVATATRLCRASGRVRAEDTAVHGIRGEDTADAAPFSDEWEIFAGMRARGPLAAHFSSTEDSLIRMAWPYSRMSPDYSRPGGTSAEWGPWIDTGRIIPGCLQGLRSARLEDLVGDCGLRSELDQLAKRYCPGGRARFHAALYDALAAALLLISLGRRAEFEGMTLPWLFAHSVMTGEARDELRQDRMF